MSYVSKTNSLKVKGSNHVSYMYTFSETIDINLTNDQIKVISFHLNLNLNHSMYSYKMVVNIAIILDQCPESI